MANIDIFRGNRTPFREMSAFSKIMDRILEDWTSTTARPYSGELSKYGYAPSCEVKEDAQNYILKFEIPGIPKDKIKVDIVENRITVSGERTDERKASEKEKDLKLHFSEIYYGSFSRSLTFPSGVDTEKADASYENGVLAISVPKKETLSSRKIEIH